jgi:hypothetical protein
LYSPVLKEVNKENAKQWKSLLDCYQNFVTSDFVHNDIKIDNIGENSAGKLEIRDFDIASPVNTCFEE